jgi:hypothetical protein
MPALPAEQLYSRRNRCGMKRQFPGLNQASASSTDRARKGLFLVRVERAQYCWHANKPYYLLGFAVLAPNDLAGHSITGRIYCTSKAMWKLAWFLRDFGYDAELLGKSEIEENALIGLRGVVKIGHTALHGTAVLNFEGFAEARQWEQLSGVLSGNPGQSEVAS